MNFMDTLLSALVDTVFPLADRDVCHSDDPLHLWFPLLDMREYADRKKDGHA